jgi:pimeloyl-ACP methyl ester carboxylesterase
MAVAVLLWRTHGPGTAALNPGKSTEELVAIRSEDDFVQCGAVFVPATNAARRTAVIWIHGWGINFYSPTYVNIGRALAERGYMCITGNTRMHDLANVMGERNGKRIRGGGYWGIATDEVKDLAGWVNFASERGFKRVVLVGHSAGWSAVKTYQALRQDPRIVGVVIASGAVQAETRSTDSDQLAQATQFMAAGRPDDLVRITNRSFPSFISAATFMDIVKTPPELKDFFGMQTTNAGVTRIRCPLLAFFGTRESGIGTEEDLERLKSSIKRLPDGPSRVETAMIRGADHMYTGEEKQVAKVIGTWAEGL